jgi:hypothetical protein
MGAAMIATSNEFHGLVTTKLPDEVGPVSLLRTACQRAVAPTDWQAKDFRFGAPAA